MTEERPVVVIGAGPVGLAAAVHLMERGIQPLVLEAGTRAGATVAQWGHVRLFSAWSEVIAPAAAKLLAEHGWESPDQSAYPTGAQWVEQYLRPLAHALGDRVRYKNRVIGVARRGRDRVVDAGRTEEPLTVHVATPTGEERISARAVIDASGTWEHTNPLGGDGLPALGERTTQQRISYRIPDLTDPAVRARYAGRRIAVAGSGHSALTALVTLADLAGNDRGTEIVWLLRRGAVGTVFGGAEADQLPARGALGQRAKAAAQAGHVRTVTGFRTAAVHTTGDDRLVLESFDGATVEAVDEVVTLTGFRPDLSWLSEVRLDLDPVLQAPRALASLIDPNVHSCGTVYPHGAKELAQPEPGFFVVGMKSYGRAPTFLAMTGYEQVRSVVAKIAGDEESANRVELTLPETGVCGGAGLFDAPAESSGDSCCSPSEPEVFTLSAPKQVS